LGGALAGSLAQERLEGDLSAGKLRLHLCDQAGNIGEALIARLVFEFFRDGAK